MASSLSNDQVLGIVLIVLGVLVLFGYLSGLIVLVGAIALIVYGILVLVGKARGATWLGVLCIVMGVLLLAPRIPAVDDLLGALVKVTIVAIGIVLLVLGILKLARK